MAECLGFLDPEKVRKFVTTYHPLEEYMVERVIRDSMGTDKAMSVGNGRTGKHNDGSQAPSINAAEIPILCYEDGYALVVYGFRFAGQLFCDEAPYCGSKDCEYRGLDR